MDMAESHVVSALANKRAEVAGAIARTQQQPGQFRADLVHLDATIRLFAPAMEPEAGSDIGSGIAGGRNFVRPRDRRSARGRRGRRRQTRLVRVY